MIMQSADKSMISVIGLGVMSQTKLAGSLRLCHIPRTGEEGRLGLHLSRTQWDPYPWISAVESGSEAAQAGLRTGDCLLEVNGEDVVGLRIAEVAKRIQLNSKSTQAELQEDILPGVSLLLWNAGTEQQPPTGVSMHRLSACVQSAAQLLECPVCLEVLRPPAWQCCHGHVLCGTCRRRSERCPVCRVTLGPRGRCLLADKLFGVLAATFGDRKVDSVKPEENKSLRGILLSSRLSPFSNRDEPKRNLSKLITYPTGTKLFKKPFILPPGNEINTKTDDNTLIENKPIMFNCPKSSHCLTRFKKDTIMSHLQSEHEEPNLQYSITSNSKREVNLKLSKNPYIISLVNEKNDIFFVGYMQANNKQHYVWLWFLGYEDDNKFKIKIYVNNKEFTGKAIPLATSWNDILSSNHCYKIDTSVNMISIELTNVNDNVS